MGKGSLQRPYDRKLYAANYERIFGNKPATNRECQLGDKCVDDCTNCSIGWKKKVCSMDKSEYCEDCRLNPDATEIQTRFFCPEKGEPLDG